MKKFISFLMVAVMLASMAVVSTSAAGQILMQDTFSGSELSEANWIVENNQFFVEQGWLKGWKGAVACQSAYYDEVSRPDANKQWSECSVSVDVAFFDYDNGDEYGIASLWWKDYVIDPAIGDDGKGNIYTLEFRLHDKEICLNLTGDFDEEEDPLVVVPFPEDLELVINEVKPSIINLGMRIQANQIDCFLNGEKIITYTPPAPIGTHKASPILLVNNGMYIGFDNFTVATVDYPLFASDLEPEATETTAAGTTAAPETSVKTEAVVVGTNDKGEDITEIVTEIVTVAPADTVTGGSAGGNGASTGDMAIIVVAVMVVALGTAIVVKKVSVK